MTGGEHAYLAKPPPPSGFWQVPCPCHPVVPPHTPPPPSWHRSGAVVLRCWTPEQEGMEEDLTIIEEFLPQWQVEEEDGLELATPEGCGSCIYTV